MPHEFDARDGDVRTTAFPGLVRANGTAIPVSAGTRSTPPPRRRVLPVPRLGLHVSGNVTVDLDWYADTASSGAVVWGVQMAAITPDTDTQDVETDALPTSPRSPTPTWARSGSACTAPRSPSPGPRWTRSPRTTTCVVRVARVAADAADTMTGDAILVTYVSVAPDLPVARDDGSDECLSGFQRRPSEGLQRNHRPPGLHVHRYGVGACLSSTETTTSGLWCYGTATDGHNTRTQTGHPLEHNSSGQTFTTVSMTVGTWYRVAWWSNGTTGTLYRGCGRGRHGVGVRHHPLITPTSFSIGNFLTGSSPLTAGWRASSSGTGSRSPRRRSRGTRRLPAQHHGEPHPVASVPGRRDHRLLRERQHAYRGHRCHHRGRAADPVGPSAGGGTISQTSIPPTVDAGKDVFGTAGFAFSIQAVETGPGITARAWTVVSGPPRWPPDRHRVAAVLVPRPPPAPTSSSTT
jgi:hypothetical protein